MAFYIYIRTCFILLIIYLISKGNNSEVTKNRLSINRCNVVGGKMTSKMLNVLYCICLLTGMYACEFCLINNIIENTGQVTNKRSY